MQKIQKLPEHIISRIAAGEVIERPAYAVKELLDNSLDAGATDISILIEDAGLKKIVVTDNGVGMSVEDLHESFKPHTTSKIYEDIIGVKTLGFRGEALASIAAVSHLTIKSRQQDKTSGNKVTIRFGEYESISPVGMPTGTVISIEQLFHTVPARKKFLKSQRTEFKHIIDLVTQYAFSYPHVRFRLTHNGKEIFDLPKSADIKDRIKILLGEEFYNQLLPVRCEDSYIKMRGFIARPQLYTRTQSKQFLYINNRVVSDKVVSNAVKEAYGNLLESLNYPVFLLHLIVPHEVVDVNVHPRKEYVSFLNTADVFAVVKETIFETLSTYNLTFYNLKFHAGSTRAGTTSLHAAQLLKESVDPWNIKNVAEILKTSDISQLHNLYLLVQTKNGLLMIDQHAAHERILYEQFLEEYKKQAMKKNSVELKNSIIIDLPFSEAELILDHLQSFKTLGFEIESFGKNTYIVHAVPELFKDRDIRLLILELLENFASEKTTDVDHVSDLMISFLACRAAIKAGDKVTREEAKKLIEKLEKTPNNATCPHGRPAKIEISLSELNKMFKR